MSTTPCERCEDFAADARKVLSQRCASDERHCSCVPHLRAEIERLTAELEEARLTLAAEKQRRSRMPSDNPDRLLAEVNAERIRRNLSWRDLATRLDVAPSALTRWHNGRWPSIAVYLNAREWLAVMRAAADTYDASK